mmetsp:Transcript_49910/g.98606  ORF Transcript_49910/g.98606 Transcript_49910/m.98606 type:complete len:284 (-) Transcript_49910:408-1259(-)
MQLRNPPASTLKQSKRTAFSTRTQKKSEVKGSPSSSHPPQKEVGRDASPGRVAVANEVSSVAADSSEEDELLSENESGTSSGRDNALPVSSLVKETQKPMRSHGASQHFEESVANPSLDSIQFIQRDDESVEQMVQSIGWDIGGTTPNGSEKTENGDSDCEIEAEKKSPSFTASKPLDQDSAPTLLSPKTTLHSPQQTPKRESQPPLHPSPSEWTARWSKKRNRQYWHNATSNISVWEDPLSSKKTKPRKKDPGASSKIPDESSTVAASSGDTRSIKRKKHTR